MGIDFQTEVKADHVRLVCQGTFSNQALFDVYQSALDIASSEGLNAVLIDIRTLDGETPTSAERFELGVTFAEIQSKHATRILTVVVGKYPLLDLNGFEETVAINRGGYGKVFSDIDAATDWLENEVESTKAS